jgi:hypothetical protein
MLHAFKLYIQTADLVPAARFLRPGFCSAEKGSGRQNKGRPTRTALRSRHNSSTHKSLVALAAVIPAVRAVTSSTRRGGLVTHASRLAVTPPAAVFAPPRTGITRQCDRNKADRSQHSHGQNDPKPVVIHRHLPPFPRTPQHRLRRSAKLHLQGSRGSDAGPEQSGNGMGRARQPSVTRENALHCKRFLLSNGTDSCDPKPLEIGVFFCRSASFPGIAGQVCVIH